MHIKVLTFFFILQGGDALYCKKRNVANVTFVAFCLKPQKANECNPTVVLQLATNATFSLQFIPFQSRLQLVRSLLYFHFSGATLFA